MSHTRRVLQVTHGVTACEAASDPVRLVSVGVKVTVLVGGIGGARFLLGVQHLLGLGQFGLTPPAPSI